MVVGGVSMGVLGAEQPSHSHSPDSSDSERFNDENFQTGGSSAGRHQACLKVVRWARARERVCVL